MLKLKDLLLEEEKSEEISNLQNKGLRDIYVLLRDALKAISDKAIISGTTINNFPQFIKSLTESDLPINVSKQRNFLTLHIPENLQKIFPALKPTLDIKFTKSNTCALNYINYNDEDDTVNIQNNTNIKITDITVSINKLLTNFDKIKPDLQHEIRHIIKVGSEINPDETNLLIQNINYLGNDGEIEAHANEFAYQYFKQFPNDLHLDLNKFYKDVAPNVERLNNLKTYVKFGSIPRQLQAKYNVNPSYIPQMFSIYNKLIRNMKRFFPLFFKKSPQNPTN